MKNETKRDDFEQSFDTEDAKEVDFGLLLHTNRFSSRSAQRRPLARPTPPDTNYRLWQLRLEFLENSLSKDRDTLIVDNRPHKSTGNDGGLQNAIKYCTKVRKTGQVGQRVE